MSVKFEYRGGSSSPSIQRIQYKEVYIYLINFYTGCSCNYIGCESMCLVRKNIKVRTLDGELILTKDGKEKLKIDKNLEVDENLAIELYKNNYK